MSLRQKNGSFLREGGTKVEVFNSGLEVWLYDAANREIIRSSGAMDFGDEGADKKFCKLTQQGIIVGYSLLQDDGVFVEVHVGEPLTEDELQVSRWLEPQKAFLQLPSGELCIESNDSSRIGIYEPTDEGGVVNLSEGDYCLHLYRVDYEALDREQLSWEGPEEVIVLTPSGSLSDAAHDILPFEPRRDTKWIGNYQINGNQANVLVWFSDYWDTFYINLDSVGAAELSLVPKTYIRIQVPDIGITLISAFDDSWDKASKLPPPQGISPDEYGYSAFFPLADWNGAEAIFCRRIQTKMCIDDAFQNMWIPAVMEVFG